MCITSWLAVCEPDQKLTQCWWPGRTCSTLRVISFCACCRAALAAWSCWTSLSRDSLSSVSSSSTLPSNCGRQQKFVTCQTCRTTQEPGDTPGLTCCAGWYLRQDCCSEIAMTIRLWQGVTVSQSCYSVLSTFAEKDERYTSGKMCVTEIFLCGKVSGE